MSASMSCYISFMNPKLDTQTHYQKHIKNANQCCKLLAIILFFPYPHKILFKWWQMLTIPNHQLDEIQGIFHISPTLNCNHSLLNVLICPPCLEGLNTLTLCFLKIIIKSSFILGIFTMFSVWQSPTSLWHCGAISNASTTNANLESWARCSNYVVYYTNFHFPKGKCHEKAPSNAKFCNAFTGYLLSGTPFSENVWTYTWWG